MNDRELLELAAKALGGEYRGHAVGGQYLAFPPDWNGIRWDPLTDDGDALRLTVSLGLSIERTKLAVHISNMPTEQQSDADERGIFLSAEILEKPPVNQFDATRLAIVRAAAKIGETIS